MKIFKIKNNTDEEIKNALKIKTQKKC